MSADLLAALCERDPHAKCEQVAALADDVRGGLAEFALDARIPGRPTRPELISPRDVPKRGLGTPEGRAAMIHAVAHIEFNAINLALDAALRFGGMPSAYYADWISVAKDEARHFLMLSGRLVQLGYRYGAFAAHNGLWEAAEKTAHDVLARMALVPRVLEARGLDATPGMILRLKDVGDAQTAAILRVILEEEVRHVAIGTHWFRHLCTQRGCDPLLTFRQLLIEHRVRLQPPYNWPARRLAGFDPAELGLEAAPALSCAQMTRPRAIGTVAT